MRFIDGQPVFDCPHCRDTGFVEVANVWRSARGARPLASFWLGKTLHLPVCIVACSCDRSRPMPGLPRFDRERMFVIDHNESVAEAAERFRDWWECGNRFGRQREFDDWNSGVNV